ncbi:hypothetical protein D9N16_06980 [Lactococcus raffinolactis]|nr:hypothetical protein [Lactococcus raffinolactis]
MLFVILSYINFIEKKKRNLYKNEEYFQKKLVKRDMILLYCYDSLIVLSVLIYSIVTLNGFLGETSI